MNKIALAHPTIDDLRAFAAGELSADVRANLETHVLECAHCCEVMGNLPGDQLALLLKNDGQAMRSTSVSTSPLAETIAPGIPHPPHLVASAALVPPELANHPRYRVLAKLGEGGMGTVYKAEHKLMERPVALKVISKHLVANPDAVKRFTREMMAAGKLAHPNIVRALDAEQSGTLHFLVMEFVSGTSLHQHVQERGPLPIGDACAFAQQTALGLQHAFEHGMIHRDIKPHNLMLTDKGRIKILDFGLARLLDPAANGASLTGSGYCMGTPDYIAPEQARDAHKADIRSDVYSLGCTLYFLLAGRPPFAEGTMMQKLAAHVKQTAKPLSDFRADMPRGLADVVARMLAKDPAKRFQSPIEVANALAPFVGTPAPLPPEALDLRPGREPTDRDSWIGKRGRWLPVALAVALAFVLGSVGVAGIVIHRIVTDWGTLIIETDDDDIHVVVKQGGKNIMIVDTKTQQKLELRSGKYEVELKGAPKGWSLSKDGFELKRGDKVIVSVRREAPPPIVVPAPTDFPNVRLVADWNFAKDAAGQPVKDGQLVATHDGEADLSDNTEGQSRGRVWHTTPGGTGPRYAAYPVKGVSFPGADAFALRTGPKHGYLFFPDERDGLRTNRDFSVWFRVQLQSLTSEPWQAMMCRPGRWAFIVRKNGTLDLRLTSEKNSLQDVFKGKGPDLTPDLGKWVDLGFSFQRKEGGEDLVKVYRAGECIGTFNGNATFDEGEHLHLGADGFGRFACDALFDRVIFFEGVIDDAGFRRLSQKGFTAPARVGAVVTMNGLAGLKQVQTVAFPDAWRKPGVFAKIQGKGEIALPRVPTSWFVLETELEIHTRESVVTFNFGDRVNGLHVELGPIWDGDKGKDKTACRLFNVHNGTYWWLGERDFKVGERLVLKLVVGDRGGRLFHNDKLILVCDAWPVDIDLRIVGRQDALATIHRCSFREVRKDDLTQLDNWVLPPKEIPHDPAKTAERIKKLVNGLGNQPKQNAAFVPATTGMPLAWIPAGEFDMGSRDPKRQDSERKHRVKISKGFWMGQCEVTQGEWKAVMGANPSRMKGSPYLPVDWVSWEDAMQFCGRLTERERKLGRIPADYVYRLPTEAEWEYACRAGSEDDFSVADFWDQDRAGERFHEVGELPANDWGLFDMHGNVMEWTLDRWYAYPKDDGVVVDPVQVGRPNFDAFVVRGGAWFYRGRDTCRSAERERNRDAAAYCGFRIVLAPEVTR